MELYLTTAGGTQDITKLLTAVTWSGDTDSIARQLSVTMVYEELSGWPVPALGDAVTLGEAGTVYFSGYVVRRRQGSEDHTLDFTCYDKGLWLKRNDGTYKFRDCSAEDMVETVCRDKGIPVASLAATGTSFSRKFSAVSLDQIITTAYSLAAEQTGERYAIRMTPEGLLVKVKGQSAQSVDLRPRSNLMEAVTEESITEMVNSVAIYSQDGELLRVTEDAGAVALYGQMQQHLTETSGRDADQEAAALLEDGGMSQDVTVSCRGDLRLITGETVTADDTVTGLHGLFWIDGDKHTWKNGQYTCSLTLNCRSVMATGSAGSELT